MAQIRAGGRLRFVRDSRAGASSLADDRGAGESLADFMTQTRGDLVALAYVLTGSRDEAQDVVHNVFVRLLSTDLTDVADLRAYARRAVTHECASWGRQVVRRGRRSRALRAEWERVLSTQPDPFGRVEVMSALACLSHRQRAVVVLRHYLGWDDEAIAATLDCAPATVRSLLSRALRTLRARLNEGAEGL